MLSPSLREHHLPNTISKVTYSGETLKVFEQYSELIRAVILEVYYHSKVKDELNQGHADRKMQFLI